MTENGIHFNKAPIVEAVIAFEIEMQPEDLLSKLAEFRSLLGPAYGNRQEFIAHKIEFGPTISPAGSREALGYTFRSLDGLYAVLVRLNGFSFSRLRPYDRWEPFRDEAKRLWKLYRTILPSGAVQTFSVRYINRLVVPAGKPISDYLRIYPKLPDGLPQSGPFAFLRLQLAIPEPQGDLVVQVQTVPSGEEDKDAYFLDNDLRFPARGLSEKKMWDALEHARGLKNEYFMAEITENTEALIS